jgi:hypothetical protein
MKKYWLTFWWLTFFVVDHFLQISILNVEHKGNYKITEVALNKSSLLLLKIIFPNTLTLPLFTINIKRNFRIFLQKKFLMLITKALIVRAKFYQTVVGRIPWLKINNIL